MSWTKLYREPVIKTYKGLRVCSSDCYARYLAEQAEQKRVASYFLPHEVSAKLLHHGHGINYDSLDKFVQAV